MRKILTVFVILIGLAAGLGLVIYDRAVSLPVGKTGEDVFFEVKSGQGVSEIASGLEQAGLIRSSWFFEVYVWQEGVESDFQAGNYALNPGQSISEIVRLMRQGNTINQEVTVRTIEGWDIRDIDSYLVERGLAAEGEFAALAKQPVSEWSFGFERPDFLSSLPGRADLEGFLFPDTYRVFRDSEPRDIIERMLNNFGKKVTKEMIADVESRGLSLYDIITLASLVEKEVRSAEDMRKVAGVFWQRIANGQPLESCATLAYILGVDKPQYSIADTEIDSPYNTYQNQGLPPGPISNPGLNAIQAAIDPEMTDYNYFLSRPDTGETVFSRTYQEHLRNKAKYLD
jgi:UPF0755 protein